MNIIYDHQIFAMQKYGGISRYFYELISRLSNEDDVRISLFLGFYINEFGLEARRNKFHKFWGSKHHQTALVKKMYSVLNRMLFKPFLFASGAQIYHPTYYADFSFPFRAKRVVTVYDMIHEAYPEFFHSRDRALTPSNKRRSIQSSDAIICISESTRNDIVNRFKVPLDRLHVIPLANSLNINVSGFPVVRNPYILFVGERKGYKNFDLLLRTYASSARINRDFALVCFGGGEFTDNERTLINSAKLENRVLFHSGSDQVLANLYQYAAVFVCPSRYEGFGIPLLEAMHYGCPVIASNVSSLPEVCGSAGLLFDPDNAEELASALERVLFDDPLRTKLVSAGFEREKQFSWDKTALLTKEVYSQI